MKPLLGGLVEEVGGLIQREIIDVHDDPTVQSPVTRRWVVYTYLVLVRVTRQDKR